MIPDRCPLTLPLYDDIHGQSDFIYGLRMLPLEGEVTEIKDATLKLANGHEAHVTMHIIDGSREEIEKQLKQSLDAFFSFYPGDLRPAIASKPHARCGRMRRVPTPSPDQRRSGVQLRAQLRWMHRCRMPRNVMRCIGMGPW